MAMEWNPSTVKIAFLFTILNMLETKIIIIIIIVISSRIITIEVLLSRQNYYLRLQKYLTLVAGHNLTELHCHHVWHINGISCSTFCIYTVYCYTKSYTLRSGGRC
jgi:uncharacterized metal-binding protein